MTKVLLQDGLGYDQENLWKKGVTHNKHSIVHSFVFCILLQSVAEDIKA